MVMKTDFNPSKSQSPQTETKKADTSLASTQWESITASVRQEIQKTIAKNQLGPQETADLLNTSILGTQKMDLELGKINKAVHEAYTFINDVGIGRHNLPNYNFELSTHPSTLTEFQAISDAVAGMKYDATLYAVGMAVSKNKSPMESALVREVKATDEQIAPTLDKREQHILGQIFTDAQKYIQNKIVASASKLEITASTQAAKQGLSDLRSPSLLATAA